MIYKIRNFTQFVPMGAQYLGVIKEQNGVFSVKYFHDENGASEALVHSLSGRVLEGETIDFLINEKKFAGKVARAIGRSIAATINECMDTAMPGHSFDACGIHTYIVETKDDLARNATSDDVRYCNVAELVSKEPFQVRDHIEIKTPLYNGTVVITKYIGEGKAKFHQEALNEFFDDYDKQRTLSEDPNPDYTGEATKKLTESTEGMPRLKDTTIAKGQAKRKLRGKADNDSKKIDDEDYVSNGGDDSVGTNRFPHSDLEKQFFDKHGLPQVMDHPANNNKWLVTVSNKDVGAKAVFGEDIAPLNSSVKEEDEKKNYEASIDLTLTQCKTDINRILKETFEHFANEKLKSINAARKRLLEKPLTIDIFSDVRPKKMVESDEFVSFRCFESYILEGLGGHQQELRNWLIFGYTMKGNIGVQKVVEYVKQKGFIQDTSFNNQEESFPSVLYYDENREAAKDEDVVIVQFVLKRAQFGSGTGPGSDGYVCDIGLVTKKLFDKSPSDGNLPPVEYYEIDDPKGVRGSIKNKKEIKK